MLQSVKEYMTTDKSVMSLKLWHDFCYSYYVKIFTQANQFNKSIRSKDHG